MLTAHYDTKDVISLDEFKRLVSERCSTSDPASLMKVGKELVQLANNQTLLASLYSEELKEWRDRLRYSIYSTQSTVLAGFDGYVLRANFWPLLPNDPRRRNILASLLSYFDFHDHDFSFLTTNFFGPGYATDLFTYRYEDVAGEVGERVAIEPTGRRMLGNGDVFLFQQGIDIHSQLEPEATSGSLNLMIANSDKIGTCEQYYFTQDGTIKHYVENITAKNCSMLSFTENLSDHRTAALLERLATAHRSKLMRSEALRNLEILSREQPVKREVFENALQDASQLVRRAAAHGLEHAHY